MKVAMLGWEFPPFMSGGLGIHCLELTTGLANRGVDIDFYMPRMASKANPTPIADQHSHLRIIEVDADGGIGPYSSKGGTYEANFNRAVANYNDRLVENFDSHGADVLHCHDWITVPAALELRQETGIPLVFTVHSTEYDRSGGFAPQAWIEDIERQGLHGADRVIAVSRYTKGLLQQNYGVDPARVVPVHNGVDVTKFASTTPRDYDAKRGTVLFLSRLTRQKGPLNFLKAAKRVLEIRPEARFVVAGHGDMLGQCIEYAFTQGIEERVQFTGFVPPEELADAYAQNEIYVLPSLSEPFGISVLEAMASGLPTIVSKTSGVGEGLAHVFKVGCEETDEMADMIVGLLDSPPLREELGRNGAAETRRFTWAASSAKTLDVYRSVVAARRPRVSAKPPKIVAPRLVLA